MHACLTFHTNIILTLIFEWYVIKCGSKNGHQKDTCLKEIGLSAQNMLTIVGSMINTNKGTYMVT